MKSDEFKWQCSQITLAMALAQLWLLGLTWVCGHKHVIHIRFLNPCIFLELLLGNLSL